MSKRFVIDTSVLIYDVESLYKFGDNEVIIPSVVYEEINELKEENSEKGYYARIVAKLLDALSSQQPLRKGVRLGDTFIHTSYETENNEVNHSLLFRKNDYKIISCAKNHNAILITRDRMMRVIARDFVEAEEYEADMIKEEIYKGYRRMIVPEYKIEQLYSHQLDNEYNLHANEFIIMESEVNPQHIGIGIRKKDRLIPVQFEKMNLKGMKTKPLNLEQKMFLYLLQDPDIICVSAIGVSGKGKSLLSIDYALSQVAQQNYNKFSYAKSVISVDKQEELGFYKGTIEEKYKPHLKPLYSAIEFLYKNEIYGDKKRVTLDQKMEELMTAETINFLPLANIRGMSVFGQMVMLDEAQNTTNHMMKTLVTRMNDDSKLIVTGDIEQIDDTHLNPYNNGLTHLIQESIEEDYIGHITMDIDPKSKRGRLSEFGTKKL